MVYSQTEIFDAENESWILVSEKGEKDSNNATDTGLFLPYNVRSSALIDLYPKLYLIGGVSCSNNMGQVI